MKKTHTFAICAYKDSIYLEECIQSLLGQEIKSDIILCTSTPSEYIRSLAQKYNIKLYINNKASSIAGDWNFAYETAKTDLVTIAHQDDIYYKTYTKNLYYMLNRFSDMSIFMTDSSTIYNKEVKKSAINFIKKILRLPLSIHLLAHKNILKYLSISFGNPVICPSCTYNKSLCGERIFNESLKFALDWEMLYRMSIKSGRWVCMEKPLLGYRVHGEATTKTCILDNTREKEEYMMFEKIWGKVIARFILFFYQLSYKRYLNK